MKAIALLASLLLPFAVCLAQTGTNALSIKAVSVDAGAPINQTWSYNLNEDLGAVLDDLYDETGTFAILNNREVSITTQIFGKPFFNFTPNPLTFTATYEAPLINFTKTFSGANAAALEAAVDAYWSSAEGQAVINDLVIALTKELLIAGSGLLPSDGTPVSTTASLASQGFFNDGFTPSGELVADADATPGTQPVSSKSAISSTIGFNSGTFNLREVEGSFMDFSYSGPLFKVIKFGVGVNYLDIEGEKFVGISNRLAVPIRLAKMSTNKRFNWSLVPAVGTAIRANKELFSGDVNSADAVWLWNTGVTNSIDVKVHPRLIVCFINQFTTYRSFKVDLDALAEQFGEDTDGELGDFDFGRINQQILKNGIRFVTPLSKRWVADTYVIDTRFLKKSEAVIESFYTVGGSLVFKLTPKRNITLGANLDKGDGFRSWSVGISSAWRF